MKHRKKKSNFGRVLRKEFRGVIDQSGYQNINSHGLLNLSILINGNFYTALIIKQYYVVIHITISSIRAAYHLNQLFDKIKTIRH